MLKLGIVFTALGAASANPITGRDPSLVARQNGRWPNPEPCTGNCSFIHDPAVIRRDDGKWFRVSTNGNIAIASAPDITGPWTYEGAMLPQGSIMHPVPENDGKGTQELWAPDVSKIGDQYYVYYTASRIGFQGSDIGVATSPNLEPGSWTDHGSLGIPVGGNGNNWNLIDPNYFRESDQTEAFFNFGSGWGDIYQTQLDRDTAMHYQSSAPPGELAFNSTHYGNDPKAIPSITEGAFEFWLPNAGPEQKKYYYLFFSSGACCNRAFGNPNEPLAAPGEEYRIYVCRSETALGPFVDQTGANCLSQNGGSLVLGSHDNVYAPGGQGVYRNPTDGKIIMYYHYVDTSRRVSNPYDYAEFQFGFNYIDFSSGWPVVQGS